MDFDEQENEIRSSSDYWSDVVKGKEKYGDEDTDDVENSEKPIFICDNCRFTYDIANPPKGYQPFGNYIYFGSSEVKCPQCGKRVKFNTIDRKKYEERLEKAKLKKEKQDEKRIDKIKEREKKQIREDITDLAEDLKERLLDNEITAIRFSFLFVALSKRIVSKNAKNLEIDWIEFRKTVFDISDDILELHEEAQKTEEILEEFDISIEEDELYKAEIAYYIDEDKFAIPEYEYSQRMKEYERIDNEIKKEAYRKEIEEKYQNRKNEYLEKSEERERRKKLHDIM